VVSDIVVISPSMGVRSIVVSMSFKSVRLSVCLFVCSNISKTTMQNFTKFTTDVGPVLFWRRYDTLCTSGHVNDVTFLYNGLYDGASIAA